MATTVRVSANDRPIPALRHNVSFLLMWSSVAASGFGDRLIQLAAEPMLGVYEATASAAQITASIMFFFFLPYMVLTVVGGWLADRLPRKWIMLVCDECRAIILLVAFFMAAGLQTAEAIHSSHHWKVYLIMTATGCFAAIFNPAKQSTVPQIVPAAHLQQANAVLAGIALIASLIGLRIGGPIVENVSVRLGLMVAVLSYGISGFFFAFLDITQHSPRRTELRASCGGILSQTAAALNYMRRHAPVRNLVILNILFWSAAWIVNAAIAALNKTQYAVPIDQYLTAKSTMMAVLGAGLLAGSMVVIWIRTRRESAIVALSGLVVASISMFVLAANRSYVVGLILAFAIGLSGGIFLICVDTLTQSITPNFVRGRVFGARALLNTSSAVLVNLLIWRAPHADFWIIPALYATAGATGAVALWSLWWQMSRGPMDTRILNVLWHFVRMYALIWHRLRWIDRHHVPQAGPVILASNHTTGLAPFLIQPAVHRTIRWVMEVDYQFPVLNFFWSAVKLIIVDRASRGMVPMRQMIQQAKDGHIIGIFPEGGAQRDNRDLKSFHAGVGLIAAQSYALIVPVWVNGTPQKRNMFWHFGWPSKSTVTFGQPYRPDASLNYAQLAEDLRQRMLALAQAHREPH